MFAPARHIPNRHGPFTPPNHGTSALCICSLTTTGRPGLTTTTPTVYLADPQDRGFANIEKLRIKVTDDGKNILLIR